MVNTTHLKVLLKKDFLTLWRNKGFLFAFLFLPIVLMAAFAYIQSLVDNGQKSGTLINDYFRYVSTEYDSFGPFKFNKNFMDVPPFITDDNNFPKQAYMSDIQGCGRPNQGKYNFTKIAIIAKDLDVLSDAKAYFEDYVFPLTGLNQFSVETFTDEQEALNIVKTVDDQPYCFAINFQNFDIATNNYKIQYSWNKNSIPDTNLDDFNELILAPDISSWDLWFNSGAISLYMYMTEFIARSATNSDMSATTPLYTQQVGYGPMKSNEFLDISPIGIQQLTMNFPFFFMIIYLIPFYYVTSKVAAEKESKSREGMKMMGLNDSTYFLSWFIVFFLISFMTSTIISIVAGIYIFKFVNMFLFFIFCMLYSMTLYGWAFTIVSFLPTKRTSGIAATLFHVISFYLSFLIQDPLTEPSLQYGLSIFPNICMNQIVKQVFFYNYNTKEGLTFNTGSITYQGYSFRGGVIMMLFNVVFWAVLGMYLDQVVPSQFGIAKHPCFCVKRKQRVVKINDGERQRLLDDDEIGSKDRRNFEMVSDSLKKQEKEGNCLKVRGLVKKFGSKTAVAGTNLTMYNGQIFALLGHNGAGKTTTLSMLTGLLQPNEGCAEVFGIDIFSNMDEMRKIMGVCPQHDVLFEFLTCEDHLRLFAAFKGTDATLIEEQVVRMLKEIDLYDQRGQLSKTLSGGQKRKLSVAIAMIGNSKIVMLDEPTSGMDTAARRKLWEMLKKNKAGRIVILTTHYMDEADILGDRIGIMAEGDVQCTGSSLFLKNRYGVGYNLVIAKKTRDPAPQIDRFIFDNIEGAKKMQEVSSEISYQLPTSSSGQFKNFFSQFDESLDALGIRSYGVGITTLEEVFLKIGHGEELEEEKFKKLQESSQREKVPMTAEEKQLEDYTITDQAEKNVFFSHTMTVMKKKILMQVRDKKTLGIDTIFPIVLIAAGLALSTVAVIKDGQSRSMSVPAIYPAPVTIFNNLESKFINPSTAGQETKIQDFIDQSIVSQSPSIYQRASGYAINIDPNNPLDILGQVSQLDDQIFDQVQSGEVGIQWGSVYINDIQNTAGKPFVYSTVLLLNSTSQSVAGAYGAMMHTAFLKDYLTKQNKLTGELNVEFIDQPFPLSKQFQAVVSTAAGTTSGILMTIAWMMISDSLVQNIIKEKQSNVKHQMLISGCSISAYWMGNYIADILFQAMPALVGIGGIHWFNIDVPKVQYIFLIVVFANPAFIYAFSFLFEKDESGSLVIKMLYFLFGIIAPITISILQVVNPATQNVASILKWFFYPLPVYSLTFGYMSISNRALIQFVNKQTEEYNIFSSQIAGPSLYFLLAAVPFYWFIVVCFELKVFDLGRYRNRNPTGGIRNSMKTDNGPNFIDEDIIEEKQRVMNKEPEQLPVRLCNLKKTYGPVTAVENVSFGLEYGECFALLGVSGAGKTTCFKSLTGEIYPTQGSVTINGHDITTAGGFESARKMIGYCPQFDAIFPGLTVVEHLQIYASLKGIKGDIAPKLIEKAIKDMDLLDYVNIAANNLSGGNKRKMSVAMALLGNPPLIFLDEPSTGVDPQAKRFMWNIVSKISTLRQKSAVIITTHSMEEAEALCTKMGIMVAGEFKCFGSSQHIKDKFGTGYELEIKIRTLTESDVNHKLAQYNIACGDSHIGMNEVKTILNGNDSLMDEISAEGLGAEFFNTFAQGKRIQASEFYRWQFVESQGNLVIDFLEMKFKDFEVLEHYGNNWKLKVSRDNFSIGFLFGLMEDIQAQYDISEYSVAQTTLEQIFNNFAQEAERAEGKGGRKFSQRRRTMSKNDTVGDSQTEHD